MLDYLIFGALVFAVLMGYGWVRDHVLSQRREVRHAEGRSRLTRAVAIAEKLGFVETTSTFGDFNDITDISLKLRSDESVWVYIQQHEEMVRATLYYYCQEQRTQVSVDFNPTSHSAFEGLLLKTKRSDL